MLSILLKYRYGSKKEEIIDHETCPTGDLYGKMRA
jgi:hypothetical protein